MTEQQMTDAKLDLVRTLHAAGAPVPLIAKITRLVDGMRETTRGARALAQWAACAAGLAVAASAAQMVLRAN